MCDTLYHNLLNMASLTKKIIAQQSQATVTALLSHASAQPRLVVPILWNILQDKAPQARTFAMGHVKTFLQVHGISSRHTIESSGSVDTLEKCVKKGLSDPNPSVREAARKAFWAFEGSWRDRARIILDASDATSRKQLEKVCPNPAVLSTFAAPTTPMVKKSSVAATIAASRARAKQIATAPPTLRHQATSAARTTSPPSKRPVSPALSSSSSTGRAASPIARISSSSSSPRARVVSAGPLSRPATSGFVPTAHNREYSRARPPASPPSPTPDPSSRRRVSSPLVSPSNSNFVLRRAVQTALPASPTRKHDEYNVSPTPRPQRHLPPPPPIHRESLSIEGLCATNDESLLLAAKIPIPEDSDSDQDMSMDIDESLNLISFSTPYEIYPPEPTSAASFSPRSSSSKPGLSNALSTATSSPPTGTLPQPIVEDAMRARAEQAESAAQRLLELVEPEEDGVQQSTLPPSLLLGTPETTPRVKVRAKVSEGVTSQTKVATGVPKTPVRNTAILRKAAQFQDSPAYKSSSTSLFDMIDSRNNFSEWWTKRKNRTCFGGITMTCVHILIYLCSQCSRGSEHPLHCSGTLGSPGGIEWVHRATGRGFRRHPCTPEACHSVQIESCERTPLSY